MAEDKEKKNKPDAFETAVKYLAVSARSEKEVKEKLYSKGFHRDEVDAALARAKGYKYIDDSAYVKCYLDTYGNKYGRKKIEYTLTSEKGVSKDVIDGILFDVLTDERELEKAKDLASKYVVKKKIKDKKDLQKVSAFLYSKGFDYSTISSAMSKLSLADEEFDF